MIIPTIIKDKPLWDLEFAIKHFYKYKMDYKVITNKDIGAESKHIPTYGTKKLSYAMEQFNPDILVKHDSTWRFTNPDSLSEIMLNLQDEKVIASGIRPWSCEGGSWHPCYADEAAHCCDIIVAYKKELYPYVENVLKYQPNSEVWNQACFHAVNDGWIVKPIFADITSVIAH